MSNLTINIDSEVLKQARIRALKENTSVNALLSQYLQEYALTEQKRQLRRQALEKLLEIARRSKTGSAGQHWSRDELYE